eukprot:scaffold1187_cov77-Skeletonema_marinoi.AAC.1
MQQHLQRFISATLALIEATPLISLDRSRSDASQGVSAICLVCSEQTQAGGGVLLYGMIDKSRDDACKTQLLHRWPQYRSQMTPHPHQGCNVYCSFGH